MWSLKTALCLKTILVLHENNIDWWINTVGVVCQFKLEILRTLVGFWTEIEFLLLKRNW